MSNYQDNLTRAQALPEKVGLLYLDLWSKHDSEYIEIGAADYEPIPQETIDRAVEAIRAEFGEDVWIELPAGDVNTISFEYHCHLDAEG